MQERSREPSVREVHVLQVVVMLDERAESVAALVVEDCWGRVENTVPGDIHEFKLSVVLQDNDEAKHLGRHKVAPANVDFFQEV